MGNNIFIAADFFAATILVFTTNLQLVQGLHQHWVGVNILERKIATIRAEDFFFVLTKIQVINNAQFAETSLACAAFNWLLQYVQTDAAVKVVLDFVLNFFSNLLLHNSVSSLEWLQGFVLCQLFNSRRVFFLSISRKLLI